MKSISKQNSVRRVNRGITLLMVLALMTMFSMLVVTFMLVTSSAKIMAVRHAEVLLDPKEREPESLRDDSDTIINKIIFGDYDSPISHLSILENLYGDGGVTGSVTNTGILKNTSPITAIDFISISNNRRRILWNQPYHQHRLGHVLTLTTFIPSAPLIQADQDIVDRYVNRSTLVYSYGLDGDNSIDIKAFSDTDVADFAKLDGKGTWTFLINSPAFSGTGEGFDPAKKSNESALSADHNGIPRVFLPNLPAYGNNVMMNPDYTAPDHLTWFLAWYELNEVDGKIRADRTIPSYHRPQIIKSYRTLLESDPDLLKAATLRPLKTQHPNFTGSNTDTKATSAVPADVVDFLSEGPWDVDNDGDTAKDSIWIDVGLQQIEDRRRSDTKPAMIQPLIAVLIRDLDGLLNVNAHGSAAHLTADTTNNFDIFPTPPTLNNTDGAYNMDKRGYGMGPAEVRLDLVLDPNPTRGKKLFEALFSMRRINSAANEGPAWVNHEYYSSGNSDYGRGRLYPDFWGFAPVIFEPLGYRFFDMANYRLFDGTSYQLLDPYVNNPYFAKIYSGDSTQFSFADLEPFLRSQNDVDSGQFSNGLKERIDRVIHDEIGGTDENAKKAAADAYFKIIRYFITTQSSDIPSPARSGGSDSTKTYSSLLERIFKYATATHYDAIVKNMSPEIIKGEKINLAKISGASTAKKSEIAHQIFLLLMVLCHDKIKDGYTETGLEDPTPDPAKTKERIITRLAQWSVNLVDFIDTDSTMTPMIFSIEPFTDTDYLTNGYSTFLGHFLNNTLDGSTPPRTWSGNMRVVFGKEDNDLFITKTFATHNRNTADSRKDNEDKCKDVHSGGCDRCLGYVDATCTKGHDEDFDQIFRPEGSLFVELYRQGDPTRWRSPNDLYETDNSLNLAKLNSFGEPIWRIMIGKEAKNKPADPDPPTDTVATIRLKNSVVQELTTNAKGKTYSFQPQQWIDSSKKGDTNFIGDCNVEPERYMFFVNDPKFVDSDSDGVVDYVDADYKERSFVNIGSLTLELNTSSSNKYYAKHTSAVTILKPNEFFMIAPRVVTSFASQEVDEELATPATPPTPPAPPTPPPPVSAFGIPKENPDPTAYTKSAAAREYSVDLRQFDGNPRVKTMIAAIKTETLETVSGDSWTNALTLGYFRDETNPELAKNLNGIGINVSEPLPKELNFTTNKYYAIPAADLVYPYKESYITSSNFDDPTYAIDNDFVKGFGTIAGFRSLFLQRLADPNRQYHPQNNPYITVDWSMVDLHVFSSEKVSTTATDNSTHSTGEFDTTTGRTKIKFGASDELYFGIREWGTTAALDDHTTKRPNIRRRDFVSADVDEESKLAENKIPNNYDQPQLNYNVTTSSDVPKWGELSYKYGDKHDATTANVDNLLNPPIPPSATPPTLHPIVDFTGVPDKGFLHFPWHDSPLASTFELMLVPAVSASRFGYDCYDMESNHNQRDAAQSLGCDGNARFRNPDNAIETGLYLNFYSAYPKPDDPITPVDESLLGSLDLVRLFEYVRVPSRFKSTVDGSGNDALSKMREPGKINLNTMNKKSWIALGGSELEYAVIDDIRRSLDSPLDAPGTGSYKGTVEFARPFRSPHAANMVPDESASTPPPTSTPSPTNPPPMLRQPVETTLFGIHKTVTISGSPVIITMQPMNDTSKPESDNLYTSLHHLLRLSEMTTTRSNVFAIWVTTGYFKVEDDGTLGAEVGIDDGTVERHRDFYIVDRSKPVGFQRGQKLNSNQIILHKKSLE